jgi:hypothetical protein
MSTQTVRTPAGSMLPVAIECSMVDSIRAMRTPESAARIRCCATIMSVMTSGSGPSSRTEPASTMSTPWSIADFITPEVSCPDCTI